MRLQDQILHPKFYIVKQFVQFCCFKLPDFIESSSMTSSIALTTTFTPSASCFSEYYIISGDPAFLSFGPPSTSDCLPSGWTVTSQYFSPGICPSGYSIACSTTINIGSVTETRATCCPSQYSCQTEDADFWTQYATEPCSKPGPSYTPSTVDATQVENSTTIISPYTFGGGANAYGISIRFQASDFSTSSPTQISTLAPSRPTLATASSTSISLANGAVEHHLTAGEKAGIGIAVSSPYSSFSP
jgi:hypothetical protein